MTHLIIKSEFLNRMCDFQEFKLCSCENAINNDKLPKWHLKRASSDMKDETILLLGGVFYDDENSIPIMRERFIVEQLNTKNCFDFDYMPRNDDTLQIDFNDIGELSFVFYQGEWQVDLPVGYKKVYFDEITNGVVHLK